MKKTIIITIIVCLALAPFIFGTPTAHKVGIEQGKDNARPLDDIETDINNSTDKVQNFGLLNSDSQEVENNLAEYQIVVFIVSTEETGEINGLNSTAIICYTTPVKDGYVWRGSNGSWASFDNLYYSVQASGNKNGLTSVKVTEYVFGEKTSTHVYVRQIIGFQTQK